MVNIYTAYTAPINPTSTSTSTSKPPLTKAQCWAGLQRKIRHAPEFVGAIATCKILKEDEAANEVTRVVTFKAEPEREVREVCRSFWPMKVDFHQTDGSVISNIISDGPSGKEEDLFMTYAFCWQHPDVSEGSDKAEELNRHHQATAKMAVDKSIEAIRRLVDQGELSN